MRLLNAFASVWLEQMVILGVTSAGTPTGELGGLRCA